MPSQKFTEYLLNKYADDFKAATTHPFLEQAGKGVIDPKSLRAWLKQDYLYAYVGYIKFASSVLSHLHIPTPLSTPSPNTSKAISVLTFSLANVKRETDFFVSTAKAHGLDVFSPDANDGAEGGLLGEYNEITRAYVDFLHAVGGVGAVEEGLVLLWAMEIAYLTAWRNAKSLRPETLTSADPSSLSQTQQALLKFVDNWTSDEFVEFVTDCADIVDGAGIEIGSALAERCETVFKRTLWLEQRFWPSV
ncbi:hypothetical protein I311_03798 [Cryptococcus gattii NT-10]|nr:hypothetical protein I311_03798 [Cryptococcus gattii NT-10]